MGTGHRNGWQGERDLTHSKCHAEHMLCNVYESSSDCNFKGRAFFTPLTIMNYMMFVRLYATRRTTWHEFTFYCTVQNRFLNLYKFVCPSVRSARTDLSTSSQILPYFEKSFIWIPVGWCRIFNGGPWAPCSITNMFIYHKKFGTNFCWKHFPNFVCNNVSLNFLSKFKKTNKKSNKI